MPTKTAVKKTAKKPVKKAPKKVTWDDFQAGFEELRNAQKEAWVAIRETQQAHKETEKSIRETQQAHKETEKVLKQTQKQMGDLGNTLGSIVEHILTPGLPQKFKKLGYSFNRISTYKFAEGVWTQVDGMLENGDTAVVVEVKTTLRETDIDNHIERMEKIRKYADEHGDKRHFMGAMASTVTDDSNRNYALKKGLFVIEPSGDDVKVIKPDGEPRVW